MKFLFYVVQGLILVLKPAKAVITEFTSTNKLYNELLTTDIYTFVYIYSKSCNWCQDLNPKFEYLTEVFSESSSSSLNFIKIDGKKSMNLARDFNIDSYPRLLLFEPSQNFASDDVNISPKHLLRSVYHGQRKITDMANYLSELTGQIPHWPGSQQNVVDLSHELTLEKLYYKLNAYWRNALHAPDEITKTESENGDTHTPEKNILILSFTTPWIDTHHQEMFQGDLPGSILDQLAKNLDPSLEFFIIDSSQESMAEITNSFRVMNFPTIVILVQGENNTDSNLLVVNLLSCDREISEKEYDILWELLNACQNSDITELETLSQRFHSIYFYPSLNNLQLEIKTEHDSVNEENFELEEDRLFDRIRDI